MKDHFAYLLEDDGRGFFQKAACEQADAFLATRGHTKTASAQNRVDQHLELLKGAGPCGASLGMTKRAMRYLEWLMSTYPSEYNAVDERNAVFDKVASEAIATDFAAIFEQCDDTLRPQLAKMGKDLVGELMALKTGTFIDADQARTAINKTANFLTEALEEGGQALRGVGGAAKGMHAAEAARSMGEYEKGIAEYGKARGVKALQVGEQAASKRKLLEGMEPGARRGWHEGQLKGLEGKQGKLLKEQSNIEGALKKPVTVPTSAPTAKPSAKTVTAPALPPPKAPGIGPSAKTVEMPAIGGKGGDAGAEKLKGELDAHMKAKKAPPAPGGSAAEAAEPPKSHEEPGKGETDVETPEAKATKPLDDKEPSLKESYHTYQSKGWAGLSPAHKRKLMTAGVVGAVGLHELDEHNRNSRA